MMINLAKCYLIPTLDWIGIVLRYIGLSSLIVSLSACGGGSGSSDVFGDGDGDGDGDGGGSLTTIHAALYKPEVDLTKVDPSKEKGSDPQGSHRISAINSAQDGRWVVKVKNSDGNPVVTLVDVATTVGESENSRIFTDLHGIASTTVKAGNNKAGDGGEFTATAEGVSISVPFEIGSIDLHLGFDSDNNGTVDPEERRKVAINEVTDNSVNLSASGTAVLSATVADEDGKAFTNPLTVDFSSDCSENGTAEIGTGITTVNGVATTTYKAKGCVGTDNIKATIQQSPTVSAAGSLTVDQPEAGSILFVSAEPKTIVLNGSGGEKSSTLTFKVVDQAGVPLANQKVSFRLLSIVGGVALVGDANEDGDIDGEDGDESPASDQKGEVSVRVNAGNVPAAITVIASIDLTAMAKSIESASSELIAVTGLPDYNSFSLSASILNVGGYDVNGVESTITVSLGDTHNNPAPDNTQVLFTTEYGRITSNSCRTKNGICSVTWSSGNPKEPDSSDTGKVLTLLNTKCDSDADGTPDKDANRRTVPYNVPCPDLLFNKETGVKGQIYGGRSTILAHTQGEESFVDANGNGLYDWVDDNNNGKYDPGAGEELENFTDLPEAFIDHNEDGVFGNSKTIGACTSKSSLNCSSWEPGGAEETFIDAHDNNGSYDAGNGIYDGLRCHPVLKEAGKCSTDLVNISRQIMLLVGGNKPYFGFYNKNKRLLTTEDDIDVDLVNDKQDNKRLIYLSDRFNASLPAGTIIKATSTNCKLSGKTEDEINDGNGYNNYFLDILFEGDDNEETTGEVTIEVVVPPRVNGISTKRTFNCMDKKKEA